MHWHSNGGNAANGVEHLKHRTHVPAQADAGGVLPVPLPAVELPQGTGDIERSSSIRVGLGSHASPSSGKVPAAVQHHHDHHESPAIHAPESPFSEAFARGRWLLGLLVLQSTSSFVLDLYKDLLREHLVVTLFLTMLVGAGGNAGNQSAIKVIRALATGSIRLSWQSFKNMMAQQAGVALLLGGGLSIGGFVRVYVTSGHVVDACAISLSLLLIVLTSVVLGTGLPFMLAHAGVDPANAGTSIQVIMDILGVAITCVTCHFILMRFAHSLPGQAQIES